MKIKTQKLNKMFAWTVCLLTTLGSNPVAYGLNAIPIPGDLNDYLPGDLNDYPPATPQVILTARTSTTIALQWSDISAVELGYEFQKQDAGGAWETINSWGIQNGGTMEHSDTDLNPDTRYCYRVVAHNAVGSRHFERCVYTTDGDSHGVWRAQVYLRTADVEYAGTDDAVKIALNEPRTTPGGNYTWMDYSHDDRERGDEFTYDLNLEEVSELSDVNRIYISKTGSNGWCIEELALLVNGQEVYNEDFGSSTCQWLDNEDGNVNYYQIPHSVLRAHRLWTDYEQPQAPFSIDSEELVSRLESIVGDAIHDINEVSWGKLYGSDYIEVGKVNENTIHVNLDFEGDGDIWDLIDLDAEVDIDFDLQLSIACNDDDEVELSIETQNFDSSVDFDFWEEILTIGIINFWEDNVEDSIEKAWTPIAKNLSFESGDLCEDGYTPTVEVEGDETYAEIQFGIEVPQSYPIPVEVTELLSGVN